MEQVNPREDADFEVGWFVRGSSRRKSYSYSSSSSVYESFFTTKYLLSYLYFYGVEFSKRKKKKSDELHFTFTFYLLCYD